MSLIHLLYPKKCPVCGSAKTADEKDVFCPDCYKNLIWVEEPCCKHCGKPVASEKVELCCDCGRRDSQLRQGTALWVYDDKGKQMMHLYKYTGQSVLSEVFGRELIKHKGRQIAAWQPDVVMAVPLHRRRLWFRGYNQAEKLAGYVAQALKIPVMESGLIRLKNTRPQNQLNDKQRRHNLSDVFEVPASAMKQIQGKRILLMDDIYTTGSTLEACGSALRQAGAEDIYFACLCIGSEESI